MHNKEQSSFPRGVVIFTVVHMVAIAVIGMAASLVGDGVPDQTHHDGHHMRLVPLYGDQDHGEAVP
jgi:hypothetical protein